MKLLHFSFPTQNNTEESEATLRYLEQRIRHLEDIHRFTADALEMAASLGDFQKSINTLQDVSLILDETESRISSLIPFQSMTFYLVDEENNDFIHSRTTPASFGDFAIEETDSMIERGVFAWALREKRPVTVSSRNKDGQFILHVLSTRSRTRGMFIGFLGDKERVSEVSLSLLSIILLNSANAIESFYLYRMIREVTETLERKETYKTLFEAAPDGVEVLDAWGNIVDINDAQKNLLGRRRDDITGRHTTDFFSESCADEFRKKSSQLREKGFCEGEIELVATSGVPIPVWRKEKAMYGKDGSFVGSIVYNRDLTERKRADEERRSLEEQLQRAKKMEALGIMAGGVAHDLNNVLSGLVSYPELLLTQLPKESPLRKPVTTIKTSGEKAAAIARDLLALARRGTAVQEIVDFNEIIAEYLESPEHANVMTLHAGVNLEINLTEHAALVDGSPVHLGKVVMNLVFNAVEAIHDEGTIVISTRNVRLNESERRFEDIRQGSYVVFTVSDSGVGITAEDRERIFEPFFTKKKMGRSGTGLGMAIVWATVKDHHGYIDIESRPGSGTTFSVYFPCAEETRRFEDIRVGPTARDYRGKGETVLVVDDEKEQRDISSSMLTRLGYSVSTVSSGEDAVEYMKIHSVDLVLLDMILMPGIDGLDTYRGILDAHPSQKAVVMSGFSYTDRVRETRQLGAGCYIGKPYGMETLGSAIRDELDR